MSTGVDVTKALQGEWDKISRSIRHQMVSRSARGANELRNASQLVLRGQRSGRRYIVPGTGRMRYNKKKHTARITYRYYTASAPGEPPAVRTGMFRLGWKPKSYIVRNGITNFTVRSRVENLQKTDNGKYLLGEILEEGTGRMAPRPHQKEIQDKALPKIIKIYNEPYA